MVGFWNEYPYRCTPHQPMHPPPTAMKGYVCYGASPRRLSIRSMQGEAREQDLSWNSGQSVSTITTLWGTQIISHISFHHSDINGDPDGVIYEL